MPKMEVEMEHRRIEELLSLTLQDSQLSRSERKALREVLAEAVARAEDALEVRRRAFALVAERLKDAEARTLLGWLQDVEGLVLERLAPAGKSGIGEAHFSPGDACRSRISGLLQQAQRSVDVCVFTITDDALSGAMLDAHDRGVSVRLITDDGKIDDLGSDVLALQAAGIPVVQDDTLAHMHHKFAIVDGWILVTGSYNWTLSAARENEENIIVTDDARLVEPFRRLFERLWHRLAPSA